MNLVNFYADNIDNLNLLRSLSRRQEKFSVYCINVQRLCNINKFMRFATHIDSFHTKPVLLGVTETWFKSNETGELHEERRPVRLYELEG